ncbi:MAG: hypothetical protein L6R39_004096 [Caloplaca ligustica]|nr:MAG: hypothetical protein L6R39_004096 [Caloplaca ligustica]
MSGFLQSVRQGFSNRQAGRTNVTANSAQQRSQNGSPATGNPTNPPSNTPASFPAAAGPNANDTLQIGGDAAPESPKFFFVEEYAKLGVKGNMHPLAAKPVYLEIADWLAHQTVEQYRLLNWFIECIQEVNNGEAAICNPKECPTMSAGRHYVYTWLNNERQPIRVPASQYIMLVQRWIVGKIHDPVAFPTDSPFGPASSSFEATYPSVVPTTSGSSNKPIPAGPTTLNRTLSDLSGRDWFGKSVGFPETFLGDVRTAWRQMFRIYAHLYHSHFVDPFWHLNKSCCPDLNSSFCFFVSVGKLYGLLTDRDLEPMQELINIWVGNGSIPGDCANGAYAVAQ